MKTYYIALVKLIILAGLLFFSVRAFSVDTITVKCDHFDFTFNPQVIFREYNDSVFLFDKWTHTIHVMDQKFACNRHFEVLDRTGEPFYANDFCLENNKIYIYKDLAVYVLDLNGKRINFIGLNKRLNGDMYQIRHSSSGRRLFVMKGKLLFNSYVYPEVHADNKLFLDPVMYEQGILTIYYLPKIPAANPDSLEMISPAEAIGTRNERYLKKDKFLPHLDERNIYLDKSGRFYISEEADEQILILDQNGKKKGSFGVPGKYYITSPYWEYHTYSNNEAFWEAYKTRRAEAYRYSEIILDEKEQLCYRFYDGPRYSEEKYLQIYKNRKLISDKAVNKDFNIFKAINGFVYSYEADPIKNELRIYKINYAELIPQN